jgi:hypothetical protein
VRGVDALEPEWKARFEPRSYWFRPSRRCHDAIHAIYQTVMGRDPRRRWVIDAELAGAFDKVAHDHILAMLDTFPAWKWSGGGSGLAWSRTAVCFALKRELLRVGYAQLRITRHMSSAGLCAVLAWSSRCGWG